MVITEAQIEQWKLRWKHVFQIDIPIDEASDERITCYVKKPSLDTLSASMRFAESDPLKSGLILFENCWLGGDERIKEDDDLKLSVISQLSKMVKVREAEIKKL